MNGVYVVRVLDTNSKGETTIRVGRDAERRQMTMQTVVYASSELEARVAGAAQLGMPQDRVQVVRIDDNPDDTEMNARQAAAEAAVDSIPAYMRNVHGQ